MKSPETKNLLENDVSAYLNGEARPEAASAVSNMPLAAKEALVSIKLLTLLFGHRLRSAFCRLFVAVADFPNAVRHCHTPHWLHTSYTIKLLFMFALLASPAVAQDLTDADNRNIAVGMAEDTFDPAVFQEEPSRDARLLDFYRELIAGKNREIADLYQETESLLAAIEERNKTIASQEATIKAWENRASGKMTRGDWAKLALTIAAPVIVIVERAFGE